MICEECGFDSPKIEVCTNCGLVVNVHPISYLPPRKVDDSVITINFEKVLAPHLMYSNMININETKNPELKRILRMNKHSNTHPFETTYALVFQEINRIASALQLPKPLIIDVRLLFRNVLKKIPKFLIKYKTQMSIAACFFVIYGLYGYLCDRDAIYELLKTGYPHKTIVNLTEKAYREILSNYKFPVINQDFPLYIDHVGRKLKSKQYWITHIHKFYNEIKIFFKCQYNIRSYILAIFAHFGVPESLLAKQFNISEGTIKKRLRELRDVLYNEQLQNPRG